MSKGWRGIFGNYYHGQGRDAKRLLVTIGDSWTAGEGALGPKWETHIDPNWYLKANTANYPFFLAEQLGRDFLNLGYPGNSNQAAYMSLIENRNIINEYDDVIVVLGITCFIRDVVVFDTQLYPTGILFNNARQHLTEDQSKYMEYYTLTMNTDKFNFLKLIHTLVSIQNLCKANGYKLSMFRAFTDDLNIDDDKVSIYADLKGSVDFDSIVDVGTHKNTMFHYLKHVETETDTVLISECLHPNSEGYRLIANKMYKFITGNEQ